MISAIYNLALTTGANRVIRGARIEHVCGDPHLGPEKDYAYGMRIIRTALEAPPCLIRWSRPSGR
jgi:hypothetical protein